MEPKNRIFIEKIKKETKMARWKHLFSKEIMDLFNFNIIGDLDDLKKSNKKKENKINNMDFLKKIGKEWEDQLKSWDFLTSEIDEKLKKEKKEKLKKYEKKWIKKNKIDVLDENYEEKRKEMAIKFEKKIQKILTKDLYILWNLLREYYKKKN